MPIINGTRRRTPSGPGGVSTSADFASSASSPAGKRILGFVNKFFRSPVTFFSGISRAAFTAGSSGSKPSASFSPTTAFSPDIAPKITLASVALRPKISRESSSDGSVNKISQLITDGFVCPTSARNKPCTRRGQGHAL